MQNADWQPDEAPIGDYDVESGDNAGHAGKRAKAGLC
jgi:hypothetical protein